MSLHWIMSLSVSAWLSQSDSSLSWGLLAHGNVRDLIHVFIYLVIDFVDGSGDLNILSIKAGLLLSGIQFPTDRSNDPCPIKCVCTVVL